MESNGEPPAAGTEAVGGSSAAGSSSGKRPNVDPLVYLREFIREKKKVQFHDDWLDFDGHKIHRSTKCGYVLQKGGPLIDIGSVWWMWHSTSADRRYTQDSTNAKHFTYIGIDRRGDLCDFLLGKSDTCTGLVKEVLEGKKRPRERAPRWPSKKAREADIETTLGDTLKYEDVVKRVRPMQDLDVVIRRPGSMVPNAHMILKIAQDEYQSISSGAKTAVPVTSSAAKAQVPLKVELEDTLRRHPDRLPILLVPANKSAPVNLLNVQDLLQFGVYTKPNPERKLFFESTRPEAVQVSRSIGGKLWTFEVRDSVNQFTKEEWKRTILVIADGNEWQFKNWPFDSVVDLFTTIRGVYFQDNEIPLPRHVYNWPCLKLNLPNEAALHRWGGMRDEIFAYVEEFMNSTRVRKFTSTTKMDSSRRMPDYLPSVL